MQKRECPSCAVEIDKREQVCPICGYELPQQKNNIKWIALFLALLFLWPFIKLIVAFINYIM